MDKHELLRLLDDNDIQRKIFNIVNAPPASPEEIADEPPIDCDEKISAEAERQLEDLRGQLDDLRTENFRLRNLLAQTQQQAKKSQDDAAAWQDACETAQRRAQALQRDFDAAQDKISHLQGIVDRKEDELQARFADGWELFQKYRRVGSHARQLLRGVFPHDDFTSFICGGAQTNSLETLWDVLRECIMNGRQQDADILWEVFEYCLEIVNASKAQAGYSVLPVNVGDRFDSEFHSESPGSRAQGKISNVCLPGYRNDYNGRIIRKSVVQVS